MTQKHSAHLFHSHGYRSTPQRLVILTILEQGQTHLTIEQILKQSREVYPTLTLSTVYRTLELFLQLGLVRTTHIAGQPPSYE